MPAMEGSNASIGRRLSHALPVLAALLALCGCSGQAPEPPPPPPAVPSEEEPSTGGRVVFGSPNEPTELNCLRVTDVPALQICGIIADTLLTYDADLRIVPRLARSYRTSPDGRSITFELRQDVRWHDGTPFTMKDVLYTVDKIRQPGSAIRGQLPALFRDIEALDTPDDWTLVARYQEPNAVAAHAWARAFIMPAHLPFAPGDATPLDRDPVGTGPFRFISWEPGQEIVLRANESYFLGRPYLDELVMRYVENSRSLSIGLTAGDLDMTSLPPAGLPENNPEIAIRRYPLLKVQFVLWNTVDESGLLADARVRRAIGLAFNRASYVEHVAKDHPPLAASTFMPWSWAHDPEVAPLPHDPARAARLFEEAGWIDRDGDGTRETPRGPAEFTVMVVSGTPAVQEGELLKEDLAALGVRVNLLALEWKVYLKRLRGGNFQGAIHRWNLDVDPDPFDFFHSSQAVGGQNYGGYSNATFDKLAEEGRAEMDAGRRAEIYREIERLLADEQPYTFFYHPVATVGMNRRVHGVTIGKRGLWGWQRSVLDWWIPEAERHAAR